MSISGNLVGSYSQIGKTFILVDSDNNQLTGVVTDNIQVFDATDNDVRLGKTYVSDSGAGTGINDIPAYHTFQGTRVITAGKVLTLPNLDSKIDNYDYTKMQAIICDFNTNLINSVSAEYVCIDDNVYLVQSTDSLSAIIKNHGTKTIDFGIVNESTKTKIIRYFMYKEI